MGKRWGGPLRRGARRGQRRGQVPERVQVLVHGLEPASSEPASGHRRGPWVELASAVATLTVILAGTSIFGGGGGGLPLPEEETRLTELGRRALHQLPLAYEADSIVVVPAATDPSVEWTGVVPEAWVEEQALPLGTSGLLEYEQLSSSAKAPEWTTRLAASDRVFTDVGPLWFACVNWPGSDECTPSLLMWHDVNFYPFATPVGSQSFLDEGSGMETVTFRANGATELRYLSIGGVHGTDIAKVEVTTADETPARAWVSRNVVRAGTTVWWATSSAPAESVTAYDRDGEPVGSVPVAAVR